MRTFFLVCAIVQSLIAGTSAAAPAPPPQKLVYTVNHSRYGRIGTYTNVISRNGNQTDVRTEIRIAVSFLGVTLFRQEASREERWADGRLVFFHGVTSTNGKPYELNGAADGDRFLLMTPFGEMTASAGVRVANPWSPVFVDGKEMLTPDRGQLDEVRVAGGEVVPVELNGRHVQVKRYDVYLLDGRKKYEVDLDDRGTPVQFVVFNNGGTITFSLNG